MNLKQKIKNFCEKHPAIVAVVLYALIAIVFTFPLISRIGSQLPQGRGDTFQAIANIDSRVASVSALNFSGKAIFLVKHLDVYLPYVFLNLFVNKYVAYNVLFLLSFVLSGFGAYLLALYFVKDKYAAFLAGIIFAFSPFHFYQATVVNLGTMHQEWLPFLALFLFKFFEEFRFKYFLAFSGAAFLIAMNEHQMLAFSLLFVVAVAVYKISVNKSILKNKKFWIYVSCLLGLLAIVAFVMFGAMLKVATSDNNFLDAGANAANKYAMLALDPLAPPIFHALWPGASEFLQKIMLGGTDRGSYFVGFSVLAMLVYFANAILKKKVTELEDKSYRRNLIFWGSSTLLFYLFSLGNSFSIGKHDIYLPYFLIYKFLPFYENIRTTGRLFVFAIMGISVLLAFAFTWLLKKNAHKQMLLTSIFAAVILLEFWVAPIPTMLVGYSSFYDKLAQDNQQYTLIEIPGSTSYEFASYDLFLNTVAKKPVLNGMPLARKISGQFDMQQGTPVVKQLLYTIPKGNDPDQKDMLDIIDSFDFSKSNEVLSFYNVRYITISKKYAKPEVVKLAENFIKAHIAYTNRFEDEYLIAYEVRQVEQKSFYVDFGSGEQFSKSFVNESDGLLSRVMGNGAKLRIVNVSKINQKVRVTVAAKNSGLQLQLAAASNGHSGLMEKLADVSKTYIFETVLVPGENAVNFVVTDAQGKAVEMVNTKKLRQGALVSSIKVTPL